MGLFSFRKKETQAATPRRGSRTRTARTAAANEYSDHEQLDPLLPEKQRARRRLVGALALVLAAVIILPMVLDSEPKPVTSDIAIQIPNKNANLPPVQAKAPADSLDADEAVVNAPVAGNGAAQSTTSTAPATSSGHGDAGNATAPAARAVAPAVSADATQGASGKEDQAKAGQADRAAQQAAARAEKEKAERAARAEREKAERQARAEKEKADRARAQAALAEKSDASSNSPDKSTAAASNAGNSAGKGHFVIRIGAFSDQSRAQNWLVKLKLNDVPSYVETRKASDGRTLYLLRSGPFKSRESAEAAGKKVRQLGLTAQIAEAS